MLVSVAALCTHDKPWVRTMARRVVRAVLTDPVTAMDNGLHAASNGVGQLIQQQLQNALGTRNITSSRRLSLESRENVENLFPSNSIISIDDHLFCFFLQTKKINNFYSFLSKLVLIKFYLITA